MTFKTLPSSIPAILWRTTKTILFSFYLLFITTFLLFSLLEFFPDLVKAVSLQNIRYYAQAAEYLADPTLVFVPRHANKVVDAIEFRGDGYSPGFGIEAVSYTHLRAHETLRHLVCRLLLEKIFFNDTATTEIYTLHIVGSVRCV